jgi:hypothetical protein
MPNVYLSQTTQTIFTPPINTYLLLSPSERLAPRLQNKRQTFFQMVTLCESICATLVLSVAKCGVITHFTNPMQTASHWFTNNLVSKLSNLVTAQVPY